MRSRLLLLAALSGCAPAWQDDLATIVAPRVVAIASEPAEAAPGTPVTLSAIVATPQGPLMMPVDWAFCRTPKPLAENGAVAPVCVTGELEPLGPPGASVMARLPAEGCRLFGPETPPRTGADPPARPRDPDVTGGHYQPVRAALADQVGVGSVRILCHLATAPLEVAAEFRQRYRANQNPAAPEILALADDLPVDLAALPVGKTVTLLARWAPASAESYLAFDPASQRLRERRESMRVSWFVTGGTISSPRGGRAESDPETRAWTTWRSESAASVHLWIVLQDSRGGLAATHRVLVAR